MRSIKFVGVLVTCALSLALGLGNLAFGADDSAAGNEQKINVGLQLYSFRAQMAKDVPGTLELAHNMGITDVEIAGVNGLSAEQLRDELKKYDLKPSGMHFQWPQLSEHLDQVIAEAKTLGLEYVTLPWIPHNGEFTPKDAQKAVTAFNKWGKQLAEAGLKFTYHPHGYEFRPQADGRSLFDLMVKETDPRYVNYEIDIFWAYDGGADPVKLMQKYPNRFPLMHLKDMRKDIKTPNYTGHEDVEADVALGKGQLDIPAILNEAIKIGVKHYYIEDESKESVQQVPVSIAYVRSIGH